jgi:peptide/nickel transport system substrate-binding protein
VAGSPSASASPGASPAAAAQGSSGAAPAAASGGAIVSTAVSPAAGNGKRGGTLVNIRNLRPTSFDPYFTLTWSSITYSSPVFSQLMRINPVKSAPVTGDDLVPDLAEKWEVSADGKVMTFYLRKGVKWHNGAPFTAKDVKFSIERMADPKITFFAGDLADLDRVETVDDSTVKVYWKVPSASRLLTFAMGYSVILNAEYAPTVDRKTEAFAMGTGPFKLVSSTPGQEYRYERNPDYYLNGLPYLDGLTIKVVGTDALLPTMISGQGDNCSWVKGCISNPQDAQQVRQQAPTLKLGVPNPPVARPLGRAVYFNTSIPGPMQSVDVRRALAEAIDIESIVARYGGPEWSVRSGFFLPGMGLDVPEVNKAIGWDKPKDQRIADAKALLAKAGFANGFQAKALVRNQQEYVEAMTLITDGWRRDLGVDVSLDTPETAVEVEQRARYDYQILWYFPTMKAGVHPSELASQFICNAPENWARYCNKDVDASFAQIAGLLSGPQLKDLTRKVETTLLADMPAVPLLYPVDITVSKPDVQGLTIQPWLTNEDYLTVWLDR